MLIGIDFDNTIVCYDTLFRELAIERRLIEADGPASKHEIRDHLRRIDREADWTQLQGLAYGPQITRAHPHPGFLEFLESAHAAGHTLTIVSHKTKHPYRGEPHDLHAAARCFMAKHDIAIPAFLEPTKEAKVDRIADLRCEVFIDDLPEFLTLSTWPTATDRLLFDPGDTHSNDPRYQRATSWSEINTLLVSNGQAQR